MRTFKVTLLYLASMFLASLLGADRQSITVYPRIGSSAPATVKVTTRIEPDASNRAACVGYDGPLQGRESCWGLDGDKERRTVEHWFRDLPGGRYVAYLVVTRVSPEGVKSSQNSVTPFCIQGGLAEEAVSCVE